MHINIKDNNIIPDIARKNLTTNSNELLQYTLNKIIHEYAFVQNILEGNSATDMA